MTAPLIPCFTRATATVGEWTERQVELLRAAARNADPLAAAMLHATGTPAARGAGPELDLETARLVIARDHGYADWDDAMASAATPLDIAFEAAADAIQWGDLDGLRALLDEQPDLVSRRSPFPHHAMLLHHVAANGIEAERQLQSPPNAAEIARLLLERGAEPDAMADTYGGGRTQTPLYLLVSSAHPARAGVQAALVAELCRGGARAGGVDGDNLPLWTAVMFGYTAAADALVRAGARADGVVLAAALGDLDAVRAGLEGERPLTATTIPPGTHVLPADRTVAHALVWAAGHDRRDVVAYLLTKAPDMTVTEPLFGATAIGYARHQGHARTVALIEAARR